MAALQTTDQQCLHASTQQFLLRSEEKKAIWLKQALTPSVSQWVMEEEVTRSGASEGSQRQTHLVKETFPPSKVMKGLLHLVC